MFQKAAAQSPAEDWLWWRKVALVLSAVAGERAAKWRMENGERKMENGIQIVFGARDSVWWVEIAAKCAQVASKLRALCAQAHRAQKLHSPFAQTKACPNERHPELSATGQLP